MARTVQILSFAGVFSPLKTFLLLLTFCLSTAPLYSQWLSGYDYRKQLTVDGADISGSVANFPLLINVTDAELQQYAQSTGFDIAFTDDDGTTQLNHELQNYNSGTGELLAWVQITLDAGVDKNIYMYFGNASITTDQSTADTWDDDYEAVYHMEEASPVDATSNNFDLTPRNGPTLALAPAGNFGNAIEFDGVDDWLDFGTDLELLRNVSQITVSAWIRPENLAASSAQIILGVARGNATTTNLSRVTIEYGDFQRMIIGARATDTGPYEVVTEGSISMTTTGQWYYFTGVVDYSAKSMRMYLDGVEIASATGLSWTSSTSSDTQSKNAGIGAEDDGSNDKFFDGLIDEVRISKTLRSPDWISITYNNLNSPAGFIKEVADLEDEDGYLNGYTLRKRITIDNNDVYGSENLINFPFLVSLTDDDLRTTGNGGSVTNANGFDIQFTGSTGVALLDHQVEHYDPATGEYIAWVRIPLLKYNEDTEILLNYGNSSVTTDQSSTSTWASDYEAVFHMDDQTTVVDAHDNSTVTNEGATETAGQIGTALDFNDAESDRVDLGQTYHVELANSMTISAWVNIDDVSQDHAILGQFDAVPNGSYLLWMDTGGSGDSFAFGAATDGVNIDKVGEDATIASLQNNWKYVVGTWDGSTIAIYVDGNLEDSQALGGTLDVKNVTAAIGDNSGSGGERRYADSQIDEVRISSIAKSADWIRTEYFNQLNPANVYTVTDETSSASAYVGTKRIIIDSDNVFGSTDHIDFPVLISITDNDLRTTANGGWVENSSGFDIIFMNQAETSRLDHELQSYNPVTGEVIAWVRIPALSPATDTEIRLKFGLAGATDLQTTNTWSSDYAGVWHFEEDPTGAILDATSNNHDGADASGTGNIVAGTGVIGQAYDFENADNQKISISDGTGSSLDITSSMTLSAWFNNESLASGFDGIIDKLDAYKMYLNVAGANPRSGFRVINGGTTTRTSSDMSVSAGTWYYMTTVYDDGNDVVKFYLDGNQVGSDVALTTSPVASNSDLEFGAEGSNNDFWDGLLDELRIQNVIRSPEWIQTEYFNQNNPSAFYSVLSDDTDQIDTYAHSKRIIIYEEKVFGAADHTDFPVLISLTHDDLRSTGNGGLVQNTSGFDIIFSNAGENLILDHEIESYNETTGEYIAWVRVPTLSINSNTEIRMHFSKTVTFDPSVSSTWANDYLSVWHLDEDVVDEATGATHVDATGNNDGTQDGNVEVVGKIANGQAFDGANDRITFSTPTPGASVTVSSWIRHNTLGETIQRYVDISNDIVIRYDGPNSGTNDQVHFYVRDGGGVIQELRADGTLTTGTWYYVTGTYDGTTQRLYVNGEEVLSEVQNITLGTPSGASQLSQASETMDGFLDEARVSNVAKTGGWIKTEYNNQNDPATFYGLFDVCAVVAGSISAQDNAIATGDSTILSIFGYEVGATIQWQSSTDSITFTDISGATTSTLNTGALTQTTYFRANVTNGCTSNVDITVAMVGDFLSDFAYRKKLTLDGSKIVGSHTEFPVLIKIENDPDLLAGIQNPSGFDIQFTDGDASTPLNFEIESYDAATGSLTAWVNMDLEDATTKEIYLYYGGDEISNPSSSATWDGDYAAVWHFNDEGDDASSNNNNASNNGTTSTDGIISGGLAFGGGDYLEVPLDPSLSFTTGYTIQVWIKPDAIPADNPGIFMHKQISPNVGGLTLEMLSGTETWVNWTYDASWQNVNSGNNSIDLDWQYITATYDGTNMNMYKNGELINSTPFAGPVNVPGTITTYIGRNSDGGTPEDFVGSMDELKLSTTARSSNWIRTEYFNQSDPASFFSVGEEEPCPIQLGTVNALDNSLASGETTTLNLSDHENGIGIQWQVSSDNVNWSDIGGATAVSYTTTALSQTTFYRVQQTATCTIATESVSVAVNGAENYSFRKRITIDGTQVVGDHSNFPLLVRIASDADLAHTGSAGDVQNINGYDIIFTEADGQTPLLHDIEKYVNTTGELVAWVGVDLEDQTTKDIFMYYGNASVSTATEVPTGVWDDSYLSVWHLVDANDASGNSHHLTSTGGDATTNDTGIIAGASAFDGSGDFLAESTTQAYLNEQLTITISAWVKPDVLTADMGFISSNPGVEDATSMWYDENGLFGNADQTYKGKVSRISTSESEAEGEEGVASTDWTHVAMTWSPADYPTLHINGRLQINTGTNGNLNQRVLREQDAMTIGGSFQGDWDGMVDEVKIHGDQRSAGWITTEYNNQRIGSDFITIGSEETDCEISPTGTLASSRSAVTSGETVALSIGDYDADVTSLQWESSTDGISFGDIASATTANITSPVLSADTYFRVRLNNGSCDAFSETLVASASPSFVANYSYRKAVTIRSSLVSGASNLVNFLAFIEITDDNLKSRSNSGHVYDENGYDLLFTLADGTVLRYERQEYDAAAGRIRAWVEIPSLSPTTDTELYLYYGNCTGLADPSTTAIWSDAGRYRSIYHMEDATDQVDASGNGFTLTNNGTAVLQGPLGAARDFGTGDYMSFADNSALINNQQIVATSMWVYPDRTDIDQNLLSLSIGGGGGTTQTSRFALEYNNDDADPPRFKLVGRADDGDGAETFAEVATTASALARADQWFHVYGQIDYLSETATLYVNGENIAATSITGAIGWTRTSTENTNSRSSALGAADDGSAPRWRGGMDEVRIMNTALSSDWIRTEYNNQRQPESFIDVDDEEIEFQWDGSESTAWSDPNNWLGCRVPGGTEFVRIPVTGNNPVLDVNASLGDLLIETGASLSLGTNTLSLSGDLTREGSLSASSGTLSFVGDEDQSISGIALVINNLTIAKPNNSILHLLSNVSVSGQLTLDDGFVALTDGNLTLGNSPAATSTSFVVTPSDHCLNQNVPNTDVLFPVGVDADSYSPVILRNSGSADDFCIRVIDGLFEDGYTGAPFADGVVNKTWLIDEDTDGGSNVTVTLQWRSVDQATGFDANNARITHYNTTLSSWEPFASNPVGGLPSGRFGVSADNVSSFSPVGAASNEDALPVELIFFDGIYKDQQVVLTWATATEVDNDFFTVQRGRNGEDFESIANVPGQGDSDQRVDYQYIDDKPLNGGSYYRLQQTDFDGTFSYSHVEFVFDGRERSSEITVFPNANDGVNFHWTLTDLVPNSPVTIALYDLNGAELVRQELQVDGSGAHAGKGFENLRLEPGVYLLKASNLGRELVHRLLVR